MNRMSHLTPPHDAYSTSDRADVGLRIYPGERSPGFVTEQLSIEPTSTNIRGEVRTSRLTGMSRTVRHNGWFLDSRGYVTSRDVRAHLDWLIDKLMPVKDALAELQALPGMIMTVTCVWHSAEGRGGPTLWPEQMAALADLDLEFGFDIYYYGEDDD